MNVNRNMSQIKKKNKIDFVKYLVVFSYKTSESVVNRKVSLPKGRLAEFES